jgi:IclR family pca regulon transcriptional regulator
LSEVAAKTGLTRGTARRFLLTLEALGYARCVDGYFRNAKLEKITRYTPTSEGAKPRLRNGEIAERALPYRVRPILAAAAA